MVFKTVDTLDLNPGELSIKTFKYDFGLSVFGVTNAA